MFKNRNEDDTIDGFIFAREYDGYYVTFNKGDYEPDGSFVKEVEVQENIDEILARIHWSLR